MDEPDLDGQLSADSDRPLQSGKDGSPRYSELKAFIRYQLSKMRAKNEHHRFEDLCRSFSRQRIAANIITATGPVSAGGDQGRDFESFMTYVKGNLRPLSVFFGVEEGHSIVFCCSLQKSSIASKILSDVQTICESMPSTSVDSIFYFTEVDIPVSKRHDLIESAGGNYGVQLNIIDGQSLSELLSEPENIWIPVEYLDVSPDLLNGSKLAAGTRELLATGDIVIRPVEQLDPVRDLGVHPPMKLSEWLDLPEYVSRSIDRDLDVVLNKNGLLVIEGGSASGKTRTAFEAIYRTVKTTAGRPILIPKDGRSLRKLVAAGYKLDNSIVWLDDLEKFIGPDGIDDGFMRLFSVNGGLTAIATLRSRAKASMESAITGPPGRSVAAISDSVLSAATILRIDRRLNSAELAEARSQATDPRIAAALLSETAGFAEHIAAAPATLLRWQNGQDGANEVGAALVSAAVDLRRAGFFSPIPREWLNAIYPAYLEPRILNRTSEADLDSGFTWATQIVSGASSCLEFAGQNLFSPFDYLVDFSQPQGTDDEAPDPFRRIADIPDLVWHELADRISVDDPSLMSCVSMSSLSLHPGLKFAYDRAVSGGLIQNSSLKDRGILLNFVRSCEFSNLCIVCQATYHNLDMTAILSVLMEECAPVLADKYRTPTSVQADSVRALASMGSDSGLRHPDAPLHEAALQTPAESWMELGQFMVSVGIDAGLNWICFAELQMGGSPDWPEEREGVGFAMPTPPTLANDEETGE